MQIQLSNIGKRFNREWIFRNIDYCFNSGKKYAIVGHNGSGKSTLLQIISGAVMHSEGNIFFSPVADAPAINSENTYQEIAFCAPYLELLEEMTAMELLNFHCAFKKFTASHFDILDKAGLIQAKDKQIRYFSSGMKQRLKLALAFFSDTPVLLLDEPTSNLDEQGITLYLELIEKHTEGRTVIICSNDKTEYHFCEHTLSIEDYKKAMVK